MAVIHHTTLKPTKLELLTGWLPSRPWFTGGHEPELVKAGGFRLDDPQGEVGMELMALVDTAGSEPVTYFVPLTYRGAPLEGADHALIGTMEHGVLGRRWVYDGCHDPALVAQLFALADGRVRAQDQNASDTPDRDVTSSYTGGPALTGAGATTRDTREGTGLRTPQGVVLDVRRVLRPASDGQAPLAPGAAGHIAGVWELPDGARVRGSFAVLHISRDE
ncbi:maltokinase N-terminal cap-like domain-containing protein [Streptomyces sp. SP18CS02]|uniref:maltokinase N-terminal cap-like domain-containing protein n=1 Tax=Streptomyces sp. SP18CS02 TaxID=3002531 RepID=UPI002E7A188A|nr:1,4-alpha-glucan branching protein [Streptomyces sp. SP18CS02]MEE1752821.1 1,4-alpha-glucan branching protein [Streptomyces sp. SP18CS02]